MSTQPTGHIEQHVQFTLGAKEWQDSGWRPLTLPLSVASSPRSLCGTTHFCWFSAQKASERAYLHDQLSKPMAFWTKTHSPRGRGPAWTFLALLPGLQKISSNVMATTWAVCVSIQAVLLQSLICLWNTSVMPTVYPERNRDPQSRMSVFKLRVVLWFSSGCPLKTSCPHMWVFREVVESGGHKTH